MAKRIRDLAIGTPAAGDYLVVDPASGNAYKIPLIGSGGVIEYGSNSNGSYLRFADGTQVCWASHDTTSFGSMQTGEDPNYKYRTKTWVYPAAFAAAPIVTVGGDVSGARMDAIGVYAVSATACILEAGQYNTTAVNVIAFTLAIGRWK